jgi:NitT/TauT family transport system ATP-binding protein
MASKKTIMSIKDLTLVRPIAGKILERLSFDVYEGEFLSIIGTSGAGKTSLLQAMAGLIEPECGKIIYKSSEVTKPRVELGLVYQNYALFPWRTALENVEFGLEIRNLPREKRRQMAKEALDLLGLLEDKDKYPIELSGGMQQRVAIAREIVNNPKVLMLDEGFSALDIQTRRELETEMLILQKELGLTVVLVTHLVEQALSLSDRALILSGGKIKKTIELSGKRPRNIDEAGFRKLLRETESLIRPTPKIEVFVKEMEEMGIFH